MLGADTKKQRTMDSVKILEYSYKNFFQINLKEKIELEFEKWKKENNITIIKGQEKTVKPVMEEPQYENYLVSKMEQDQLDVILECVENIDAPVANGEEVRECKCFTKWSKDNEIKNIYK